MKKYKLLSLLLVVAILLAGCGEAAAPESNGISSGAKYDTADSADIYYRYETEMEMGSEEKPSQSGTTSVPQVNAQKLIRTITVEAETNDLDALLAQLDAKISAMGGYVENRSVRNGSASATRRYRYASLTIRVPVDQLDSFAAHIKDQSNVVTFNENAKDITLSYIATQSRITALQTEEVRLLELMAKAEDMSDLLQIQQRLTDVRTELEEVTSQLRLYDNLVDYGTINLSVSEVQEYTPVEKETLWQRIGGGLSENWEALCIGAENVFVFLITSLPFLIPLAFAGGITILAVKLANRKIGKKKKDDQETKE